MGEEPSTKRRVTSRICEAGAAPVSIPQSGWVRDTSEAEGLPTKEAKQSDACGVRFLVGSNPLSLVAERDEYSQARRTDLGEETTGTASLSLKWLFSSSPVETGLADFSSRAVAPALQSDPATFRCMVAVANVVQVLHSSTEPICAGYGTSRAQFWSYKCDYTLNLSNRAERILTSDLGRRPDGP